MPHTVITITPPPEPKPDARHEIAKGIIVTTVSRLLVDAIKECLREAFDSF